VARFDVLPLPPDLISPYESGMSTGEINDFFFFPLLLLFLDGERVCSWKLPFSLLFTFFSSSALPRSFRTGGLKGIHLLFFLFFPSSLARENGKSKEGLPCRLFPSPSASPSLSNLLSCDAYIYLFNHLLFFVFFLLFFSSLLFFSPREKKRDFSFLFIRKSFRPFSSPLLHFERKGENALD